MERLGSNGANKGKFIRKTSSEAGSINLHLWQSRNRISRIENRERHISYLVRWIPGSHNEARIIIIPERAKERWSHCIYAITRHFYIKGGQKRESLSDRAEKKNDITLLVLLSHIAGSIFCRPGGGMHQCLSFRRRHKRKGELRKKSASQKTNAYCLETIEGPTEAAAEVQMSV